MNKLLYGAILLAVLLMVSCAKEPKQRGDMRPLFDSNIPLLSGPGQMHMPAFHSPTTAEMDKLREEVGFDKKTETKIMGIIRDFNNFMKVSVVKVQREELNIREELLKDGPDLQYVQKCIQNKTQIFAGIEYNQIKRDIDIKALLTGEQYETWMSALSHKMHERMPGMPDHDRPFSGQMPPAGQMPPPGPMPSSGN